MPLLLYVINTSQKTETSNVWLIAGIRPGVDIRLIPSESFIMCTAQQRRVESREQRSPEGGALVEPHSTGTREEHMLFCINPHLQTSGFDKSSILFHCLSEFNEKCNTTFPSWTSSSADLKLWMLPSELIYEHKVMHMAWNIE